MAHQVNKSALQEVCKDNSVGTSVVEWFIMLKSKDLSKSELGVKVHNVQTETLWCSE